MTAAGWGVGEGEGGGRGEEEKNLSAPLSTPAEKILVLQSASVVRFGVSLMQIFCLFNLFSDKPAAQAAGADPSQ